MNKIILGIVCLLSYSLQAAIQFQNDQGEMITKRKLEHELIIKLKQLPHESSEGVSSMQTLQSFGSNLDVLLQKDGESIVSVEVHSETMMKFLKEELSTRDDVDWVEHNYEYLRDPREGLKTKNDPFVAKQIHHQIMKNLDSWSVASGSEKIIVAITDDGVQLDHKDLKAAIWQNTAEIPDNGKDDDNNGYVDDTVGWDFSDDDNNPTGGRHGTHVAGIVGASTNEFGGAGVAPGVKLMAIRWYGGRNRWTSKIIMKSYAYAVDNGAKIINTSYNIDGFANDKTYLAAVDYVYEKGGIIFNSAGNGARLNSPRQKVEKVVLVASTQSDPNEPEKIDKVSSFSNYGKGVDIAAPGNPIYSTVLSSSSNYGNMSGTSMASPNAAGAAALIWSKFPKLTRAQVLQALYKGADNINKKILKKYVGNIGAGRVNTLAAIQYLQNESARANVIDIRQNDLVSGFSGSQKTSFKLSLSGSLSADQSLSEGSMLLVSAGDDGLFDTDDDKVYPLKLNKNYSDISQSVEVYTDEKIESGFYAVSIKTSQLKDAFGRPMGGNISSNSFIKYFSL